MEGMQKKGRNKAELPQLPSDAVIQGTLCHSKLKVILMLAKSSFSTAYQVNRYDCENSCI